MALTPPTLVNATACGQLMELGRFVLAAQLAPDQNPDAVAIINNLNLDYDTNVGSFTVNFEFEHKVDPTTGDLVAVVKDPYNDPTP